MITLREALRCYGHPLPEDVVAACNVLTRSEWAAMAKAARVGYWRDMSGLERDAMERVRRVKAEVARALAAPGGGAR